MADAFDADTYLANKVADLNKGNLHGAEAKQWTVAALKAELDRQGLTPESHYEKYGKSEGLSPGKAATSTFNTDLYLQNKAKQLNQIRQGGRSDWTVADTRNAIAESGMTAEEHAKRYGNSEGVLGYGDYAGFNTDAYLRNKTKQLNQTGQDGRSWTVEDTRKAIANAGMNPLEHYINYGLNEGVSPLEQKDDEDTRYAKLLDALKNDLGIDHFVDLTKSELTSIKDMLRNPVTQKENPEGFQSGYGYDHRSENWIDGNGNQNEAVKPSWLQGYGTFQPPQQTDWMKLFTDQGFGTFSYQSDPSLENLLSFSNLFNYAQSVPRAEIDPSDKLSALQTKINDAVNNNQISPGKAQELLDELRKNTDLVNKLYAEYGESGRKGSSIRDGGENGGGANLN